MEKGYKLNSVDRLCFSNLADNLEKLLAGTYAQELILQLGSAGSETHISVFATKRKHPKLGCSEGQSITTCYSAEAPLTRQA
jgi:hypothetical protein